MHAISADNRCPHKGIEPTSMAPAGNPQSNPSKSTVALLLSFVAGSVDVVGFLTLHYVFTAHVSGTTAHLGIDLAGHEWSEAAIAAAVVGAFFCGSVMGRIIIEIGARVQFRRIASVTLALEALLLALFVLEMRTGTLSHFSPSVQRVCWLLGSLGCAMGLQTATLTRIGPLTIHTTFVTGMLNKLSQLVSHVLFETYSLHRPAAGRQGHWRERRRTAASQATFIAGIWFIYLAGALVGAFLDSHFGPPALYLGVILLSCAIAVDGVRPLSLEEERDQSER
jgi:uncharacterized membrane protein YoaK (UPF0700 family)